MTDRRDPDLFDPPPAPDRPGETAHRLDGLEPDNLLAFLALLGLLRALETARPDWRPRAHWDPDHLPLRPVLTLATPATQAEIAQAAADGCAVLAADYDFGGREQLDHTVAELREIHARVLVGHGADDEMAEDKERRLSIFAGLLNESCLHTDQKKRKEGRLARSQLNCLDVASVKFLKNLSMAVGPDDSVAGQIKDAVFHAWRRAKRFTTFRFDHAEYRRHAYRDKAPTKEQTTTEPGAIRLGAFGLAAILGAAVDEGGRIVFSTSGMAYQPKAGHTMSWPIWTRPASLAVIRALLGHPQIVRDAPSKAVLGRLGVSQVRRSVRMSRGEYSTFLRAEAL
jgi:hypothetical protein